MLRMIKVTLGLLVLALILQISILYAIYSGHGFQILMLFICDFAPNSSASSKVLTSVPKKDVMCLTEKVLVSNKLCSDMSYDAVGGVLAAQLCLTLFVTPWTVACQAPWSTEFSRQEYWSGLPFSSRGDLPNPGIESGSPALQADSPPFVGCELNVSKIMILSNKVSLK